jgi:hypothetical protein
VPIDSKGFAEKLIPISQLLLLNTLDLSPCWWYLETLSWVVLQLGFLLPLFNTGQCSGAFSALRNILLEHFYSPSLQSSLCSLLSQFLLNRIWSFSEFSQPQLCLSRSLPINLLGLNSRSALDGPGVCLEELWILQLDALEQLVFLQVYIWNRSWLFT